MVECKRELTHSSRRSLATSSYSDKGTPYIEISRSSGKHLTAHGIRAVCAYFGLCGRHMQGNISCAIWAGLTYPRVQPVPGATKHTTTDKRARLECARLGCLLC